jgi:hypothetical protein
MFGRAHLCKSNGLFLSAMVICDADGGILKSESYRGDGKVHDAGYRYRRLVRFLATGDGQGE